MNSKFKLAFFTLLFIYSVLIMMYLSAGSDLALFNSKGMIARQQRDLMITAVLIMSVIVFPVVGAIFYVGWKYRDNNKSRKRNADWIQGKKLIALQWLAPAVIVLALSLITWKSTHALDPYKPLVADSTPVKIQVVALQWKWLFIYPEYGVATVNYIQFPEDTPINFELTADGPMSSFWIPNLGGQIYAMTGMSTKLHLMADEPGTYPGYPAEINGKGFAGMKFSAHATSYDEFLQWIDSVKKIPNGLDMETYDELSEPSENNPVVYFSSTEDDLYNKIMMKFMEPKNETDNGNSHHTKLE